jgi:RimJ/RimL family protein N-acetyltransferase
LLDGFRSAALARAWANSALDSVAALGAALASEGASALVAKGFTDMGFTRIVAATMAVNRASRRVMEKTGLTYVRTVYPHWADPLPGSEFGEVEYEIAREEWEARLSGATIGDR